MFHKINKSISFLNINNKRSVPYLPKFTQADLHLCIFSLSKYSEENLAFH